jgi:hypothetical protein
MKKLILHASALAGLLIFLKQAWTYAPLDRALLTGISTGLGIYLVLFLGTILVRHIAAQAPEASGDDDEPADADSAPDTTAEPEDASSTSDEPAPAETAEPVAAPMA